MSAADRKYLESVARATRNKLLADAAGKEMNVAAVEDLYAKNSGTGGWRVRLGSVANGNVELQVWYDKFIGNSRRRLWIGLYSRLAANIEPYVDQNHFDIGDDDIVRDPHSGEWIVRTGRRKIYFDRPVLERFKSGSHVWSAYFGRYLISREGKIEKLKADTAANQAAAFLQDVVSGHASPTAITISPSLFRRALERFQSRHVSEDGRRLRSFDDSSAYVVRTERYKSAIPERASAILEPGTWTRAAIGKGDILSRVINAIELPKNNLLFWQAQYGPESAVHQRLKAALRSAKKRAGLDELFYELYKRQNTDQRIFHELITYTGKRYELLAYLFFIANPNNFLPLRTTHFDDALRQIGVDLRTRGNCNWQNYQSFIAVVREVQRRLHAEGFLNASLLDAHSFLWILSQESTETEIRIASPELQKFKGRFELAAKNRDFSPNDEAAIRDMKRDAERRWASGEVAEEHARNAEIERLTNANRKDLASRVKIVSDRPAFGYDIRSYDSDGRDRYIEVKNVTNGRRFFLSEGEWLNSRKRKNYWFYLVDEGKGRHPIISCVKAEQLTQRNLQPVQYLVRY